MRWTVLALLLAACSPVEQGGLGAGALERTALEAFYTEARDIEPQIAADFACLRIGGGPAASPLDPDAALVRALERQWDVPVFAGSRCSIGKDSLVDAPGMTGEGKMLTVSALACSQAAQRCTASIGYYVANMGGGGTDVTLARESGEWTVTRGGSMWVS